MDEVVKAALQDRTANLKAYAAQFADGETQGEAWFDRQIADLETARANYHAALAEAADIDAMLGDAQ
jgi:hypothetical protein